ncbi:MAG TPA: AAA family ATPase, partial [Methylomirabilota bacterium]|nr:AAA family ATPase [Methylomirabilota bacterium]
RFRRVQFTSDLLPADILGTTVLDARTGAFEFRPGPIFANVVLADEINRTTPKTQSALLEAMNEAQVSLDHSTYPLPRPFMVLATQNPREYEGTFPLPESQLDRFLLRLRIGYPAAADEKAVLRGETAPPPVGVAPVVLAEEVLGLQEAAERVRAEESVLDYLVALVTATRRSPLLALGVSPRGSLALLRAARARALADGRDYLLPDDIKELAGPALAHRVIVKASVAGAAASGMDGEAAIAAILQDVPVPR